MDVGLSRTLPYYSSQPEKKRWTDTEKRKRSTGLVGVPQKSTGERESGLTVKILEFGQQRTVIRNWSFITEGVPGT